MIGYNKKQHIDKRVFWMRLDKGEWLFSEFILSKRDVISQRIEHGGGWLFASVEDLITWADTIGTVKTKPAQFKKIIAELRKGIDNA